MYQPMVVAVFLCGDQVWNLPKCHMTEICNVKVLDCCEPTNTQIMAASILCSLECVYIVSGKPKEYFLEHLSEKWADREAPYRNKHCPTNLTANDKICKILTITSDLSSLHGQAGSSQV